MQRSLRHVKCGKEGRQEFTGGIRNLLKSNRFAIGKRNVDGLLGDGMDLGEGGGAVDVEIRQLGPDGYGHFGSLAHPFLLPGGLRVREGLVLLLPLLLLFFGFAILLFDATSVQGVLGIISVPLLAFADPTTFFQNSGQKLRLHVDDAIEQTVNRGLLL